MTLNFEPHVQFKDRVPLSIGLIRTGDTMPFANVILESAWTPLQGGAMKAVEITAPGKARLIDAARADAQAGRGAAARAAHRLLRHRPEQLSRHQLRW